MAINKTLLIPLASLLTVAITLTAVTAAVLNTQNYIPASGAIQGTNTQNSNNTNDNDQKNTITSTLNLAIYNDENATSDCENIIWGDLNSGSEATKTIYIKNTGNTAATLSMEASSWSPADASDKLTLTWNQEGNTLAAGATIVATLTLQIAENTGELSDFSFNIVISGSSQ